MKQRRTAGEDMEEMGRDEKEGWKIMEEGKNRGTSGEGVSGS